MERGYVKFFLGQQDKLFGFVVDENGKDLFFHYSDGREVVLDARQNIKLQHAQIRLSYPKAGDRLLFTRGRNQKGPKAFPWCFEADYDRLVESRKRDLTLEEARQWLSKARAEVLEYTDTTQDSWTQAIQTAHTSSITWSKGNQRLAEGEFTRKFRRFKGQAPDHDRLEDATFRVTVFSPDDQWFRRTRFEGKEAESLKELGAERTVCKGVYESVMWNGGVEEFVVDPTNVRDLTAEEKAENRRCIEPFLGNYQWLRCTFVPQHGAPGQVVKIIAHLGGQD